MMRDYNPICQAIAEGKQCTRPAAVVHHLKDPKDAPELFFDWSNLVAVCTEHHAGGERGETQGQKYVATTGPAGAVYDHGNGATDWNRKPETELEMLYRMALGG